MLAITWKTLILGAFLALAAQPAAGEDVKEEMKKLEGTWKVEAIEIGGRKVVVGKGSPEKLVITDGKLTIWAGEKAFGPFKDCELELDPKAKPKAATIKLESGAPVPAIYELKDKRLKLAVPRAPEKPDQELTRPESFDTKGKAVIVYVARRSKD